jgi:serine/tyrosine/threonine adenylyltransferase
MENISLQTLPFSAKFAELPAKFYTRLPPTGIPQPELVHANSAAAALLGLDAEAIFSPEWVAYFSGNSLLPGCDPMAAVYSGHQFGVWAGQLGDGRAHLLGGVAVNGAYWEMQLKGAGPTPYSRRADGRAVLRSSIREYLCSEAMFSLGIPTTRALSLVSSSLPVRRETWERGAVVCRLAPSFLRFGSFQHWAAQDDIPALQTLTDHVIDHFRPEIRTLTGNPAEHLLRDVTQRTAELMAQWMAVGFMHGVMNTDNMSILGLTLDYGPFGFMETFEPNHICNHSDPEGRYSYTNQPTMGHWNCYALADAISPLLASEAAGMALVKQVFPATYTTHFTTLMRRKFGFETSQPNDEKWILSALRHLQTHHLDYPQFFRRLSHVYRHPSMADEILADLYVDRAACSVWLGTWRDRLQVETRGDENRQADMLATNPKYILRNWIAEQAIQQAEAGNYAEVARVYTCLMKPFDEQPEYEDLARLPPEWARGLEVSCSS